MSVGLQQAPWQARTCARELMRGWLQLLLWQLAPDLALECNMQGQQVRRINTPLDSTLQSWRQAQAGTTLKRTPTPTATPTLAPSPAPTPTHEHGATVVLQGTRHDLAGARGVVVHEDLCTRATGGGSRDACVSQPVMGLRLPPM